MDVKPAKIYYGPGGYWKGVAAIKKLAEAAKVPEKAAKKWLIRQALWQIYLPAPKRIPRPKFDVPTPNRVIRLTFFFCRTTSSLVAAKFSNTRSPLSTWPAASKRPNP